MTSSPSTANIKPSSKSVLFSRFSKIMFVVLVLFTGVWQLRSANPEPLPDGSLSSIPVGNSPASLALSKLEIKGRAPKTGYKRELFSSGWGTIGNCDTRNFILARDLTSIIYAENSCKVTRGTLLDPYTGKTIAFLRGKDTSDDVQIDHVVALSDAWQKGAQNLTASERYALANDPLELLAVDGKANQAKGDSDSASWLPSNKSFRCAYVARQIAVKTKYKLWVTQAEYQSMAKILINCPSETLPT